MLSLFQLLEHCKGLYFRKVQLKKQGKYKGKVEFPKFKKKSKAIGSFRLTGSIKVYEDGIQLPRLGKLRLKERGYLPTSGIHIFSATVSEQAGRWFVSLQVEQEIPEPVNTATSATGSETSRVEARTEQQIGVS